MGTPTTLPKPVIRLLPNQADQAAFVVLDRDGDGRLSREEWLLAGYSIERLAAFDANGDGRISEEEFLEARTFEREFNSYDVTGKGFLSRNMLGDCLKAAKQRVSNAIDSVKDRFERFDANGDGKISREEFIAGRRREEARQLAPLPPFRPTARVTQPMAPLFNRTAPAPVERVETPDDGGLFPLSRVIVPSLD